MTDRDLSPLVGELYQAGAGGESDWLSAGEKLCRALGAREASLSVRQGDGSSLNILKPLDSEETLYNAYYRLVDPIRSAAEAMRFNGNWQDAVRFNDEIVSDDIYRQSEFYRDFARHYGQEHMMVGSLGDRDHTLLVLFRDGRPFTHNDKDVMARLLPHVRNTLELQRRLALAGVMTAVGLASLEANSSSAIVVGADMIVRFANGVAQKTAGQSTSSFLFRRNGPQGGPGTGQMAARFTADNQNLKALVADTASGKGTGGALRLRKGTPDSAEVRYDAALISKIPPEYGVASRNVGDSPVLVVVRELSRPSVPPPALFGDLFGLSKTEAAVAVAVLGGRSAEEVAAQRQVSLETVRSQIRAVLTKSEAVNLRDFERIGAVLGSMQTGAGP